MNLSPKQKAKLLDALQTVTEYVTKTPAMQSCTNCDYETDGQCEQYAEKIPEEYYEKNADCPMWICRIAF